MGFEQRLHRVREVIAEIGLMINFRKLREQLVERRVITGLQRIDEAEESFGLEHTCGFGQHGFARIERQLVEEENGVDAVEVSVGEGEFSRRRLAGNRSVQRAEGVCVRREDMARSGRPRRCGPSATQAA